MGQEPIDLKAGRLPIVRATGCDVTYELIVQGGLLKNELWLPAPRTRLLLRYDIDGELHARILSGRSSAV